MRRKRKGRAVRDMNPSPVRRNVFYGFGIHPSFIFADSKSDNVLLQMQKFVQKRRDNRL